MRYLHPDGERRPATRVALCGDGRIRRANVTTDGFFTQAASVKVRGRDVAGHVQTCVYTGQLIFMPGAAAAGPFWRDIPKPHRSLNQ